MSALREEVIAEVRSWIGTPFHHQARMKKVGVDCLMLLAEVYEFCGVIPHVNPGYYPADWHMHRSIERYLDGLMKHAQEVKTPKPGDVALFKFGRCYSHGAIITDWPNMVHAFWLARRVMESRADLHPFLDRPVRFFDAIGDR